jgi:hypothetical protein
LAVDAKADPATPTASPFTKVRREIIPVSILFDPAACVRATEEKQPGNAGKYPIHCRNQPCRAESVYLPPLRSCADKERAGSLFNWFGLSLPDQIISPLSQDWQRALSAVHVP